MSVTISKVRMTKITKYCSAKSARRTPRSQLSQRDVNIRLSMDWSKIKLKNGKQF
jgi:hypothetical protein